MTDGAPRGPRFLRGWYWPLLGPFWILWQVVKSPGSWVTILAIAGLLQLGGIDLVRGYVKRIRDEREARAQLEQAKADLAHLQGEFQSLADETRLDDVYQLAVTRTGLFTWEVAPLDGKGQPVAAAATVNVESGLYQWVRSTIKEIRDRSQEDVALSKKGEDNYVLSSLKDLEDGALKLALRTRFVAYRAPAGWPNEGERKVDLGKWELEVRSANDRPLAIGGDWLSQASAARWAKLAAGASQDESTLFTPEVDLGTMPRGTRCRYAFRSSRQGAVAPGWVLIGKEQVPSGP